MNLMFNESTIISDVSHLKELGIPFVEHDEAFVCDDVTIIANSRSRATTQLLAQDFVSGRRKSFNIQFIEKVDDNTKNDKVNMYLMYIDSAARDAIAESSDLVGELLNQIAKKSTIGKRMLESGSVVRFEKLNTPRRYAGKLKEGQSDLFSFIMVSYPKKQTE